MCVKLTVETIFLEETFFLADRQVNRVGADDTVNGRGLK